MMRSRKEASTMPTKKATPKAAPKAPVTSRALIQRINRKLKPDWLTLKTTRGDRWRSNLGDYYVVNVYHNSIAYTHVNLEVYAKELGVMGEWEELKDEEDES
jgi:hypothetical protein